MPSAAATKARTPFTATFDAPLVLLGDAAVPDAEPLDELPPAGVVADGDEPEAADAPVGIPKPFTLPERGPGPAEADACIHARKMMYGTR